MNKSKEKCQHIKVFVRVRPLNSPEKSSKSVCVVDCPSNKEVVVNERQTDRFTKRFTFDRSFGPASSQIEVYSHVVKPLIKEVLDGYNCTVFAYGQTGTGNTFTMEGEKSDESTVAWSVDPLSGIIPRALSHLFDELRMLEADYSMRVSFLELYNEELFDLLSPVDDTNKIRLFEDATKKGSVIVHGLKELSVNNKHEVYSIMERGSKKRQTAATQMNARSSRSHTVFSITVHIKENTVDGEELLKTGKLNLVDLAGSENIGRSGAVDKRAREAGSINQSLLTLGRVITCLVEKAPHVPYRESKLTRLLQESLGGRTKTSIIATVSPAQCNLEETLSTLEYAHRAKNIQNKPEVNQKLEKKALINEYMEEIVRLQRDLLATQERTGIYIDSANYQTLLSTIEDQKKEITDYISSFKSLTELAEKKEEMNIQLSITLDECNEKLVHTEGKLHVTKKKLKDIEESRDEKQFLLDHHVQTELQLTEQAKNLLSVADISTTDIHKLHETLNRKSNLEEDNFSKVQGFKDKHSNKLSVIKEKMEEISEENSNFRASLREILETGHAKTKDDIADGEKDIESVIETQNNTIRNLDETYKQAFREKNSIIEKLFLEIETVDSKHRNILEELVGNIECICNNLFLSNKMAQVEMEKMSSYILCSMEENEKKIEQISVCANEQLKVLQDKYSKQKQEFVKLFEIVTKIEAEKEEMQMLINAMVKSNGNLNVDIGHVKLQLESVEMDYLPSHLCTQSENFAAAVVSTNNTTNAVRNSIQQYTETTANLLTQEKESYTGIMDQVTTNKLKQEISQKEFSDVIKDGIENVSSDIDSMHTCREKEQEVFRSLLEELQCKNKSIFKKVLDMQTSVVDNFQKQVDANTVEVRSLEEFVTKTICECDEHVHTFACSDLKRDVPSGSTPQRRDYEYPRDLVATSPHERIISRWRASKEEFEIKKVESLPVPSSDDACNEIQIPRRALSSTNISSNNISYSSSFCSEPNISIMTDKENVLNNKSILTGKETVLVTSQTHNDTKRVLAEHN